MPSFVITGVSRGIGYEFLRQYSSDPQNIVVGLVRNKAETDKKVSEDADLKTRSNLHILQADVTDYDALKAAAAETAKITGGGLDYLIANAGYISPIDAVVPIGELFVSLPLGSGSQLTESSADRPEEVSKTMRDLFEVNVLGQIHLFHLFTPLILKGGAKKVILVGSGFADIDFTNKWDMFPGALYSISKVAANMVVAKFNAQYKGDGVLFLSVAPGTVDVGQYAHLTEEEQQKMGAMAAKFMAHAPHFAGPDTPEHAVGLMREVIANASIEKGNGGDFVSQFGNRQWL
ncbi:hypothetical protein QBC47DRAFT_683 [Echria macrotheca]|uniref:NAD(P)-binding protein n=1 Tax=Echria macrotheca TaxID=438768 RepID=A0AAJ0BNL1_9PEZI|nr:hypothetical protein QBC47DRAFT_683 [Echria macrotheca]